MDDRGLPVDHLGDEAVDQDVVVAQLAMLVGIKAERQNRAGHGVAGRVVAADDQQNDVAERVLGSMSRVASACAIIESRSLLGAVFTRSFHSLAK